MKRVLATLVASVFVAAGGQALAQADFKANYKITMTQAATHPYGCLLYTSRCV